MRSLKNGFTTSKAEETARNGKQERSKTVQNQ